MMDQLKSLPGWLRATLLLISTILGVGFLGYQFELTLPRKLSELSIQG